MSLVCSLTLLPFGLSATGEIDGIAVHHHLAHAWTGVVTFDGHSASPSKTKPSADFLAVFGLIWNSRHSKDLSQQQ
jgi:hypothetical protein